MGLVQMTLYSLFRALSTSQTRYRVYLSYFEIYNEQIFDLLRENKGSKSRRDDTGNKPLELLTDKDKKNIIQDLTEVQCKGWKDALKVFQQGETQRKFSSTEMNHNSSRSHVVFQIRIDLRMLQKSIIRKCPKIMLLDLAGSESLKRVGLDSKKQVKESANINKSLLALTRIISQLNRVRDLF